MKRVRFGGISDINYFDLDTHRQEIKSPQSFIVNTPSERSVVAAAASNSTKTESENSSSFGWWWIVIGILLLILLVYILTRYFFSNDRLKNAKKNLDK